MRIKHFIFSALLLQAGALLAQNNATQQVEKSVEAFRLALIDPTAEKLDGLVADQLSYGHSSGRIEDKKTFMENLLNGNSNFDDIALSDQKITIQKKTAVVRHRLSAKTNDKGKGPGEVALHVMTVWIKDGKTWKLLARQAVRLS